MSIRGRNIGKTIRFRIREVLNPVARGIFVKGDRARDAGELSAAAEFYTRGLKLLPHRWEIRVQLGHALKELGKLEEAMAQYLRALEDAPRNADLHIQIGHLYRLRHDNARAAEHYTLGLQLGLDDPHARHFLQHVHPPGASHVHPPEASIAQQKRILWLSPESPTARAESQRLFDLGKNVQIKLLPRDLPDGNRLSGAGVALTDYDMVIVAEDTSLFDEVLRAHGGACIFRSFGMSARVGDRLWDSNVRSLVSVRSNVSFALPTQAAVDLEENWIKTRSSAVPRTVASLPPAIEGAATGPNGKTRTFVRVPLDTDDPDMVRIRKFVDVHFSGEPYRVVRGKADGVHGLLEDDLNALRECSSALYPYGDRATLHLFAIELLLLEIPLVYFSGGLLSELVGQAAPGEVRTIEQAHQLCARLNEGDPNLRTQILGAQVRARSAYLPESVWPAFDRELAAVIARTPMASTLRIPGEDEARQLAHLVLASLDPANRRQAGFQEYAVQSLYHVALGREPDDESIRKRLRQFREHGRIDLALRDLASVEEVQGHAELSPLLRWLGRKSVRRHIVAPVRAGPE